MNKLASCPGAVEGELGFPDCESIYYICSRYLTQYPWRSVRRVILTSLGTLAVYACDAPAKSNTMSRHTPHQLQPVIHYDR